MEKTILLFFNLVWSVFILLAITWLALGAYNTASAIIHLLSVLFVVTNILALKGKRWATIISAIFVVLLFIRWVPMVVINFYMYFTGHELYLDSPATIFIVIIYFIVFALPSSIMLWFFITKRKQLFKSLKNNQTNI